MTRFVGFQENDFRGIAGTTWRGKQNEGSLAGALLERLGAKPYGPRYGSWAMGRFPALIIASAAHFSYKRDRWRHAKFNVWLREDEVTFGLWSEKIPRSPRGPEHWRRLLHHLSPGREMHDVVTSVGAEHHLDVWMGHTRERWAITGDALELWPSRQPRISWREALDTMRRVPDDTWSCVYVARFMPKAEAIAMGGDIAGLIGDVFQELEPVYLSVVEGEEVIS